MLTIAQVWIEREIRTKVVDLQVGSQKYSTVLRNLQQKTQISGVSTLY